MGGEKHLPGAPVRLRPNSALSQEDASLPKLPGGRDLVNVFFYNNLKVCATNITALKFFSIKMSMGE